GDELGIGLPASAPVTFLFGGVLTGLVVCAAFLLVGTRTGALPRGRVAPDGPGDTAGAAGVGGLSAGQPRPGPGAAARATAVRPGLVGCPAFPVAGARAAALARGPVAPDGPGDPPGAGVGGALALGPPRPGPGAAARAAAVAPASARPAPDRRARAVMVECL